MQTKKILHILASKSLGRTGDDQVTNYPEASTELGMDSRETEIHGGYALAEESNSHRPVAHITSN